MVKIDSEVSNSGTGILRGVLETRDTEILILFGERCQEYSHLLDEQIGSAEAHGLGE